MNDIKIHIDYETGYFTTVHTYHLTDARLTAAERFALTYLMYIAQLPQHDTSVSGLAKELGIKRDTVSRWLSKLEGYKYITVFKDDFNNIVGVEITPEGDGLQGCPKMGQGVPENGAGGCPKIGQGGAPKSGTNNIYIYQYTPGGSDTTETTTASTEADDIKRASAESGSDASAKWSSFDSEEQSDAPHGAGRVRRKAAAKNYSDDALFIELYNLLPRRGRKVNAFQAYTRTTAKHHISDDEWRRMVRRFSADMAGREEKYITTPPIFFGEGTRGGNTCLNYRDAVFEEPVTPGQRPVEYYEAEAGPDTPADLSRLAAFVERNS